jgi:hypothetical protein
VKLDAPSTATKISPSRISGLAINDRDLLAGIVDEDLVAGRMLLAHRRRKLKARDIIADFHRLLMSRRSGGLEADQVFRDRILAVLRHAARRSCSVIASHSAMRPWPFAIMAIATSSFVSHSGVMKRHVPTPSIKLKENGITELYRLPMVSWSCFLPPRSKYRPQYD